MLDRDVTGATVAEGDRPVLVDVGTDGVARVTLNRPHVNNAYDGAMIDALLEAVRSARETPGIRAVLLTGAGRYFQAGADLAWMAGVRASDAEANLKVSVDLSTALREMSELPVPVVARVHGGCFGGGTGILAVADVVVACRDAKFSITEVRWGLQPGPIVPYLNDAIGVRQTSRYALTGERFDAAEAHRIGLVHELAEPDELDAATSRVLDGILAGAPGAIATTKAHLAEYAWRQTSSAQFMYLASNHARSRQLAEADAGLAAFAERVPPPWVQV